MIPANEYFRESRKHIETALIERDLLLMLSHSFGRRLDEMTRQQALESWMAALPPERAQVAADMLWRIFPYNKENLSKWQQSAP